MEQLEAEINPALDDDPQVALSYLFTKAIEAMKSNPEVGVVCVPSAPLTSLSLSLSPLHVCVDMDVP